MGRIQSIAFDRAKTESLDIDSDVSGRGSACAPSKEAEVVSEQCSLPPVVDGPDHVLSRMTWGASAEARSFSHGSPTFQR